VLILWARLGRALPERYARIDGRVPVTGTEWEFEDALAGTRLKGSPDLLVDRKSTGRPCWSFPLPPRWKRAQRQLNQSRDAVRPDEAKRAAFGSAQGVLCAARSLSVPFMYKSARDVRHLE